MAFLDEWKEKSGDIARAGVAKSKQIMEMAKCRLDIMAEQDAIKRAYQQIGMRYYAQNGAEPEREYADACRKITAAKMKIAAKERRVEELRGNVDQEQADWE